MEDVYVICGTNEIADAQPRGFVLMRKEPNGEPKPWPIIISRKGNNFYGFENACPHQGKRLDSEPGQFLDDEGNFLTCGTHHAQFDIDTGECFIGPCQGTRLPVVDLLIDDGDICITGVELAEED